MTDYYAECGEGWKKLYEPLAQQAQREGALISQIKEKFGGLRFYCHGASEDLHEKIVAAERESYHICEECGETGSRRSIRGWYKTLCDGHATAFGADNCHQDKGTGTDG